MSDKWLRIQRDEVRERNRVEREQQTAQVLRRAADANRDRDDNQEAGGL